MLSLVVPVYNETNAVDRFVDTVSEVFTDRTSVSIEFVFVNDGSTDDTLRRLLDRQARDRRLKVLDLSRNFGKEAALTAGLLSATVDVVVPIDVDLQDPPELIPEMIENAAGPLKRMKRKL